jgi:excisionase family DNA binding protein
MKKIEQFYTPEEIADSLKLNIITIYRYIRSKKIKAYKISNTYRIDEKTFKEFIKKRIVK